jgi:hypothetical protein
MRVMGLVYTGFRLIQGTIRLRSAKRRLRKVRFRFQPVYHANPFGTEIFHDLIAQKLWEVATADNLKSFLSPPVNDDSSLRADCEALLSLDRNSVRTFLC